MAVANGADDRWSAAVCEMENGCAIVKPGKGMRDDDVHTSNQNNNNCFCFVSIFLSRHVATIPLYCAIYLITCESQSNSDAPSQEWLAGPILMCVFVGGDFFIAYTLTDNADK